jgi:hypothetical protein
VALQTLDGLIFLLSRAMIWSSIEKFGTGLSDEIVFKYLGFDRIDAKAE